MFLDEKVQGERAWILWRRRWCCLRRIELNEGGLCEEDMMVLDENEHGRLCEEVMMLLTEKNLTVRAWTWWGRWQCFLMRRTLVKEHELFDEDEGDGISQWEECYCKSMNFLMKKVMNLDEKNVNERGAWDFEEEDHVAWWEACEWKRSVPGFMRKRKIVS